MTEISMEEIKELSVLDWLNCVSNLSDTAKSGPLRLASWEELEFLFSQSTDVIKSDLKDYGALGAPDQIKLIIAWRHKLARDKSIANAIERKKAEAEKKRLMGDFEQEREEAEKIQKILEKGDSTGQLKASPFKVHNTNSGYQNCGPTNPSIFEIKAPLHLTLLFTYHYWMRKSAVGAQLSLKHVKSGAIFGPWDVTTSTSEVGASPDYHWTVKPKEITVLPTGAYEIIDEFDPASWSCNAGSNNAGYFIVEGVEYTFNSTS
jgi:hypothetical protein